MRCLQERARSEAKKDLENSPNIYTIPSTVTVFRVKSVSGVFERRDRKGRGGRRGSEEGLSIKFFVSLDHGLNFYRVANL